MEQQNQFTTFKTVLVYTAFILLAPISSFFVSKFVFFETMFGMGGVSSNVWAAIVAVIVLHVAVGMYIYRAYFEAEKSKPEEKID